MASNDMIKHIVSRFFILYIKLVTYTVSCNPASMLRIENFPERYLIRK